MEREVHQSLDRRGVGPTFRKAGNVARLVHVYFAQQSTQAPSSPQRESRMFLPDLGTALSRSQLENCITAIATTGGEC